MSKKHIKYCFSGHIGIGYDIKMSHLLLYNYFGDLILFSKSKMLSS